MVLFNKSRQADRCQSKSYSMHQGHVQREAFKSLTEDEQLTMHKLFARGYNRSQAYDIIQTRSLLGRM